LIIPAGRIITLFYHFQARQDGNLLDGAIQVAVERNAMQASLIPVLHQLVEFRTKSEMSAHPAIVKRS